MLILADLPPPPGVHTWSADQHNQSHNPPPYKHMHAHREACLCWGQYKSQIDLNPHPQILFKLDFGLILFRPLMSVL